MKNYIQHYIHNLKLDEADHFLRSQNIYLSEEEIQVVYSTIKQDWETIIFGDGLSIFEQKKGFIQPLNYQKLLNLYHLSKEKYQNYL